MCAWRPPGQTPQLPPWVWAWRSPWVGAWRPPRPDPSTSPLGVGLETLQARPLNFPSPGCGSGDPPGQIPQLPPGYGSGDLQCVLGYHHPPPVNRITDTCENITFPQLRLRTVIKHLKERPLLILSPKGLWQSIS